MLEDLYLDPVPRTNCLFMNEWLILIFYVDDILIAYILKHKDHINEFKLRLMSKYKIRKLGEVKHFLEIQIV